MSVDAQLRPEFIDALGHRLVLDDGATPLATGLPWPLVSRIQAHLRAQAGNRRGEVQIVDRRVVDQHRVALWIHARGDGPDHVVPVAGVYGLVCDEEKLVVS